MNHKGAIVIFEKQVSNRAIAKDNTKEKQEMRF